MKNRLQILCLLEVLRLARTMEPVKCQYTHSQCQAIDVNSEEFKINCLEGATDIRSCYSLCRKNPDSFTCRGYCPAYVDHCIRTTTTTPKLEETTQSSTVIPSSTVSQISVRPETYGSTKEKGYQPSQNYEIPFYVSIGFNIALVSLLIGIIFYFCCKPPIRCFGFRYDCRARSGSIGSTNTDTDSGSPLKDLKTDAETAVGGPSHQLRTSDYGVKRGTNSTARYTNYSLQDDNGINAADSSDCEMASLYSNTDSSTTDHMS